jgi:cysteine desulfurase
MRTAQKRNEIYLDHGATTPVHPDVVAAMLPYWHEEFANPSSHHRSGYRAARAVGLARELVADLLGASPDEIYFTGCGTESNNLALRGAMLAARSAGRGNHLITSCVEHSAVLETARQLRDHFGFDLTILPVNDHGQVSPDEVEAAIRPDTVMISVMAANNEIGSVQPWTEIGSIARARGLLYHSDAVQLVAMRQWDLSSEPIDLMTLAPHKFYGPKGVGILYVRDGVGLLPTLTGGGHEKGLRAGTINVPLVVGAAEALRLAMVERAERMVHFVKMRNILLREIPAALPDRCMITGHPEHRLPHHASFAFKGISGNDLLMHLDMAGVAASSGSACSSGDPKPSPILEALGLDATWTKGGLRLTVGRQNTMEEIEQVVLLIPSLIDRLLALENRFNPVPA